MSVGDERRSRGPGAGGGTRSRSGNQQPAREPGPGTGTRTSSGGLDGRSGEATAAVRPRSSGAARCGSATYAAGPTRNALRAPPSELPKPGIVRHAHRSLLRPCAAAGVGGAQPPLRRNASPARRFSLARIPARELSARHARTIIGQRPRRSTVPALGGPSLEELDAEEEVQAPARARATDRGLRWEDRSGSGHEDRGWSPTPGQAGRRPPRFGGGRFALLGAGQLEGRATGAALPRLLAGRRPPGGAAGVLLRRRPRGVAGTQDAVLAAPAGTQVDGSSDRPEERNREKKKEPASAGHGEDSVLEGISGAAARQGGGGETLRSASPRSGPSRGRGRVAEKKPRAPKADSVGSARSASQRVGYFWRPSMAIMHTARPRPRRRSRRPSSSSAKFSSVWNTKGLKRCWKKPRGRPSVVARS